MRESMTAPSTALRLWLFVAIGVGLAALSVLGLHDQPGLLVIALTILAIVGVLGWISYEWRLPLVASPRSSKRSKRAGLSEPFTPYSDIVSPGSR
jgi:hypothetical protein